MFLLKLMPIFLFCLPAIAAAGETITVHFDDLPGRETRRTALIGNELSMDIEGDPELLEEMEEQGAKFPFKFAQRDVQTTLTRTQTENPDGSFELERTIEEWASYVRDENGKEIEIETPLGSLKGLAIRATHHPDGRLTFIDFKGGNFDDEQRIQLADQLAWKIGRYLRNAHLVNRVTRGIHDQGHGPVRAVAERRHVDHRVGGSFGANYDFGVHRGPIRPDPLLGLDATIDRMSRRRLGSHHQSARSGRSGRILDSRTDLPAQVAEPRLERLGVNQVGASQR